MERDWEKEFKNVGAIWTYKHGDLYHALLTSEKHSDFFINSGLLGADALLMDMAAERLIIKIYEELFKDRPPEIYLSIGPAMGAITFAHSAASYISRIRGAGGKRCMTYFTEKSDDGKSMIFKRPVRIEKGAPTLLVEDVITTGGSLGKTGQAVIEKGGNVLPFVIALVNRSGGEKINSKEIYSLMNPCVPAWDPKECPLCKKGSIAIRPKEADNWARLTGR